MGSKLIKSWLDRDERDEMAFLDKIPFPQLVEEFAKYYPNTLWPKEHYKIIKDEKAFRDFIDWLPELQDGEQFYYALFARSKYDTTGTLKADKAQLARGVTTKDRLFDKIKKLEVEKGTYKIGDITVPDNTLALYIHPNPRSMKKASMTTLKMIVDNIEKDRYQNPKSIALNALQVAKSRSVYVDFDYDIANENYDNHIKDIIGEAAGETGYRILKTKGGYHILIRPSEMTNNSWYQNLKKGTDQVGDLLMPVPGCVQSDFIPRFI